jgi:hypothetical protein
MHEGDPAGQLTAENRTNKPCLSCHPKYSTSSELTAHTKHKQDSTGSNCYNCHMPKVVYGVMTFHPTHDITVPDPQLTASQSVPNACNQCHLEKSVNWSIAEAKRLWPERFGTIQISPDTQFDKPEGPRSLFAGDALTRALAADALSGNGSQPPDLNWATPFLIEALEDDYPIVRFFAGQGLSKQPWITVRPDYLASRDQRAATIRQLRELCLSNYRGGCLEAELLRQELRGKRRDVDLEVGE